MHSAPPKKKPLVVKQHAAFNENICLEVKIPLPVGALKVNHRISPLAGNLKAATKPKKKNPPQTPFAWFLNIYPGVLNSPGGHYLKGDVAGPVPHSARM